MNAFPTSGDLSNQQAAHPSLPESFLRHLGNLREWRQLATAMEETSESGAPLHYRTTHMLERDRSFVRHIPGYSKSALSSFAKLQSEYGSIQGSTDVVVQDDKWEKPDLIRPDVPAWTSIMQGFYAQRDQSSTSGLRIFVLRSNSDLPNSEPGDDDLFGSDTDEELDDTGSEEVEEIETSNADDPDDCKYYRMIMVEEPSSGNAQVKVEWASELINRQDILSPDSYESWTAYRITSGKSELFLTANSEGRRTYRIQDEAGNSMVDFDTGSLPTLTAPYEVPEQWAGELLDRLRVGL